MSDIQKSQRRMTSSYTVSIIDDDESVRTALGGLVRSMGFIAHVFSSAEEFLKIDDVHASDCIISDIHMPRICGEQLQKALAKIDCRVPMIFMTAFPELGLKERVLAAGAICFLCKPFEANEMMRCISRALEITPTPIE